MDPLFDKLLNGTPVGIVAIVAIWLMFKQPKPKTVEKPPDKSIHYLESIAAHIASVDEGNRSIAAILSTVSTDQKLATASITRLERIIEGQILAK